MKRIKESGMSFGDFSDETIFLIENSPLHVSFGKGTKTVEFILLTDEDKLIFLEAKTSCPNAANKDENVDKRTKFEEYYSEIVDKFDDSFQIFLTTVLKRKTLTAEIGMEILKKQTILKPAFFLFWLYEQH